MLFNRETGELIMPKDRHDFEHLTTRGFVDLPPDLVQRVDQTYEGIRRITLSSKSPLLQSLREALPTKLSRRGKKS
jgi:hypothetical protein